MIFDRFFTEIQDIGNFLIVFANRHNLQHRDFPVGEIMFQNPAILALTFL
jgi:hypothetical protein